MSRPDRARVYISPLPPGEGSGVRGAANRLSNGLCARWGAISVGQAVPNGSKLLLTKNESSAT